MDGSARNEQRFPDGRIVALSAAGQVSRPSQRGLARRFSMRSCRRRSRSRLRRISSCRRPASRGTAVFPVDFVPLPTTVVA